MNEWDDLSDDELRARLLARGAAETYVEMLVSHRDLTAVRQQIADLLR